MTAVELVKSKVTEKKTGLVEREAPAYIQELFEILRRLRADLAKRGNVPPYVVFADTSLIEMATYLPQNESEMKRIAGVGDLKFEKYGKEFLHEVQQYCSSHDLSSRLHLKRRTREKKTEKRGKVKVSTHQTSFDMFRSGMSINAIAAERNLGISTIEGHLARFVESGEIHLDELVPLEKVAAIQQAIEECDNPEGWLSPIKEMLGEDYTYGEIRAVLGATNS